MAPMFRLIHPEHDVAAQHVTERVDDDRRRERLVVPQHLLNFLVPVDDEDRLGHFVRHT